MAACEVRVVWRTSNCFLRWRDVAIDFMTGLSREQDVRPSGYGLARRPSLRKGMRTSSALAQIASLATTTFSSLRTMDTEATTLVKGEAAGLSSYGHHAPATPRSSKSEPAWSRGLATRLTLAGFSARTERSYPGQKRKKCDVVVDVGGAGGAWLELKGAWRNYWVTRRQEWIYRSYLLHPLVKGLDPKPHTVPQDLQKLDVLRPTDAAHVGLLLLGFESAADPMTGDVDELTRLAGLGHAPWTTFTDRWPAPHHPGHVVRVWLWIKPT